MNDTSNQNDLITGGTLAQFSIWSILRTTMFVAGWFAMLQTWPGLAVFLLGVWMAFWSTRLLFRLRGRGASLFKHGLYCTLMIFCWMLFYLISIGPAVAAVEALNISDYRF